MFMTCTRYKVLRGSGNAHAGPTRPDLGGRGILRKETEETVMTSRPRRALVTTAASAAAALTLIMSTASPAAAHVTASPSSTAAGDYSVVTFSAGHGCEDSPTTEVAIKIPQELHTATPTRLAGWDVEKVMQRLETPVTGPHGNQITERVEQVVYTAQEPLPNGYRVAFEVSVRLPENAAGTTLHFPTIQRCVEGQHDWIEIPAQGQDPDSLESPAPAITVTQASADTAHGADAPAPAQPIDQEPTAATTSTGMSPAFGIAALSLGLLGTVLGGAALLRGRSRA